MEKLNEDVLSFIETIKPQLDGSIVIIKSEDWSTVEDLYPRINSHNLQFMLTLRNVEYAVKLRTISLAAGCTDHKDVVELQDGLQEFYTIYKERFDNYFSNVAKIFEDLIRLEKLAKKDAGKKSKLSYQETEVKFQSDITNSMQKLRVQMQKLTNSVNPTTLEIPTFNDTPIPLVMREIAEKEFPQIKIFLEKKENASITTSSSPDTKSTGVSEGSKA